MRLAGRAKAGFYPTPSSVVQRIIHFIKPCPEPVEGPGTDRVRILDPCCGLGDPLKAMAGHTKAESYGIELDRNRAEAAKGKLSRVIRSDTFSARVQAGAFSLLFLNPPYDQDDHGRLEHRFLVQSTAWLAPRGLLIYIIPQGRYHQNALRYLASWYDGIRLFRFPDEDYGRFKQTVLFGVKKPRAYWDPNLQEQMKGPLRGTLPALPLEGPPLYTLPAVPGNGDILFRSGEADPEEALAEIAVHGAWRLPEVIENLEPDGKPCPVRPLMPLRQGHLAQLIAAGFINNQVLEKDGKRLLIKGRTSKSTIRFPGTEDGTVIERDVIRTTITALDEKGRITEVGERK